MYRLIQDQSQPGSDQLFIRGIWGVGTTVFFVGDQGRIYTYDGASNDSTASLTHGPRRCGARGARRSTTCGWWASAS